MTLALYAPLLHAQLTFTEAGEAAGVAYAFDISEDLPNAADYQAGGIAAGDYDRDGDVDLYLVTGDTTPNRLLRNDAGVFTDVSEAAGVGLQGHFSSGPAFADLDGDGWLDLTVGGIFGETFRVFRNLGNGRFEDVTATSGIAIESDEQNDFSTSFGDPDGDGDLDAFISHWGLTGKVNHFWLNDGSGHFHPADGYVGLLPEEGFINSFTGTFADADGDGRQDLFLASDFATSQVLLNRSGLQFEEVSADEIDDENGMGSAVADFDNDGDLDWFVTSIFRDGPPIGAIGSSGNRLYRNDGAGQFTDVTETAGVRRGYWGWGACAADFDNDGWLDIFHVNGQPAEDTVEDFLNDPSRLFMNQGDGTFVERSAELGINETDLGRGVACFDHDQDGDVDIFTQNWDAPAHLFRNNLNSDNHWLQVRLEGESINPTAIGAVIRVLAGGLQQMREVTVGSNFESQNPLLQHFGLGAAATADEIRVIWPHGGETVLNDVAADQAITLSAQQSDPPPFAIDGGLSGAWFDATHNGEGFLLEILQSGLSIMYWFTYDTAGEQDWYFAAGQAEGRRILFPEVLRVSGPVFGPDFDPSSVVKTVVGSAQFTWRDCSNGQMDWFIDGQYDNQEIARLTTVNGLNCPLPAEPAPQAGNNRSGSWYDPSHDGEGFIVEELDGGVPLVYWFSYGPEGGRRWFFGVGEQRDGVLVFDEMVSTSGPAFGPAFEPGDLEVQDWGMLELDIDCATGTARYDSIQPGFGSGEQNLIRISTLEGISCP
jgi:hypothetical protein